MPRVDAGGMVYICVCLCACACVRVEGDYCGSVLGGMDATGKTTIGGKATAMRSTILCVYVCGAYGLSGGWGLGIYQEHSLKKDRSRWACGEEEGASH